VFLRLTEGIWNQYADRVLYFADFGFELALREVILGAANKSATSEVFGAIEGNPGSVRVARMRLSCSTFELQDCSVP
jgi:hypothetical protein